MTVARIAQLAQMLALFALGIVAVTLLVVTVLSAVGVLPWLEFAATFGDVTYIHAGRATQVFVTGVLVVLFFFIPSTARMMALERDHRTFAISMDDVARAYHLCHTADRAGAFSLSSEFDAVRERLTVLRDHPDLRELESDVLTVAAQMSHQARRLADVYSDDKVKRAKEFLRHRQQEAETQQARIVEALHACREIRKWAQQVELEESVVASQLAQLDEQLQEALPALGYAFGDALPAGVKPVTRADNIVPMAIKPAAE